MTKKWDRVLIFGLLLAVILSNIVQIAEQK